ncbi:PeptidyltRNA hydrolase PTH2 domain containing protein [Acanthamoeba castellanii str. Neff]|uniref:peptidyl-tRNA hydrolase n=1 Tax=Acanthamoeba castellanii (strain ATCC 30010 / Neff) TaxID=1257118 RepID=L8H778_ACACF|nr:PeptidyltRNA hydrolase PTH2 domain containing protein [Acanthamoeba castellanii str. Neff]ELR20568.1 PeptidyltRNA hydrolase PTH2 domain containing protein [Acanthamoeba castellanii str. Neff]
MKKRLCWRQPSSSLFVIRVAQQSSPMLPQLHHLDAGLASLLASLQQAMTQPSPAHEGAKMVLCVRRDLAMTTGKIAAQCSHATLGLYKTMVAHHSRLLEEWEDSHCPKIALKLDDEKQMYIPEHLLAAMLGLPTHIVSDAGKTQIARGSRKQIDPFSLHCSGVYPNLALNTPKRNTGRKSAVDSVTGELKLL